MVNLTLMSATKCEVNYVQCLRLYIMLPMQGKDQHKFLDLTSNNKDRKKSCMKASILELYSACFQI